MSNLFDYLNWRGDLTLSQDPFHEVDNLMLATLAYMRLPCGEPHLGYSSAVGRLGIGLSLLPEKLQRIHDGNGAVCGH